MSMDVLALFADLPAATLEILARGPVDEPECAACDALDAGLAELNAIPDPLPEDFDTEAWLRAGHAVRALRLWHDPINDTPAIVRPFQRVMEHAIAVAAPGDHDARERVDAWMRVDQGQSHRFLQTLSDELAWPRCLLLYVLAGWRPETTCPTPRRLPPDA